MPTKPTHQDLERRIIYLEKKVSGLAKAETVLRESEEKYRLHFERISEVIFSIDSRLRLLTISPSVERELGYRPEELIGKSFADLGIIDPGSLKKAIEDAGRTLAGERLPVSVYEFIAKEGTRKWIEVSSARMVPNENDISVVCVARDISDRLKSEKELQRARDELERRVEERTADLMKANRDLQAEIEDRKITEKALMESELKYRTVFDHTSDGISVYQQSVKTSQRRLVDCNMSYALMSGRDKVELLSEEDIRKYRQNDNEEIKINVDDKNTVVGGTFSWERPDRKINFIEYRAVPVKIDGKTLMFSINRDVTRQKQNEKRLRYLTSRLINAQEQERKRISHELHDELGQMLAVIKHRLKSIQKGLARTQTSLTEGCKEALLYINQIIGNVRRLSRELSPSILTDLGLSAAIAHMIEKMENQYAIKVLSAIKNIDLFFSPKEQTNLYRIFQEVFTNIGKHAGASRVLIRTAIEKNSISFTLQDNGMGFDMESASTKAYENKGMGLETMYERAVMLNGKLDIFSKLGKGTRVRIRVPIVNRGED